VILLAHRLKHTTFTRYHPLDMSTPSSAPMAVFGCIGDVSVQTATAPVALGKKGVAICTVGSAAQPSASAARPAAAASAAPLHIIIFQPSTRRPEFSTPLTSSFVLTLNDDDNGVWFHSVPAASEAPPPSAASSGKSSKVVKPPAASSSAPVPLLVQFSQREEQEEFCRAILLAKDQVLHCMLSLAYLFVLPLIFLFSHRFAGAPRAADSRAALS
jgi:hypothetical protein